MITLGERVGDGVRAIIYRIDSDHVVKVPKPDTAAEWIRYEERFTKIVHACGAPAPSGSRTVEIDGNLGLISTYIPGPTLWEALVAKPERAEELASLLADLQRQVFAVPPTAALPSVASRLGGKLWMASRELDLDLHAMHQWLERPGVRGLCHGDLHPYNVILSPTGPVLVDWFDAAIGVFSADVARTVVLLDQHLEAPGLADFQHAYLAAVRTAGTLVEQDFTRWVLVQRTTRLTEGLDLDCHDEVREEILATDWT